MICNNIMCFCTGECERRVEAKSNKAQQLAAKARVYEEAKEAQARNKLVKIYDAILPDMEKAASNGATSYRLNASHVYQILDIEAGNLFLPIRNIFIENGFRIERVAGGFMVYWG